MCESAVLNKLTWCCCWCCCVYAEEDSVCQSVLNKLTWCCCWCCCCWCCCYVYAEEDSVCQSVLNKSVMSFGKINWYIFTSPCHILFQVARGNNTRFVIHYPNSDMSEDDDHKGLMDEHMLVYKEVKSCHSTTPLQCHNSSLIYKDDLQYSLIQ